MNLSLILVIILLLVGLRTLCWHLQCWQIREYRFDRMKAWVNTKDGKQYFVPWWSAGIWPRPKLSARIMVIGGLWFYISLLILATLWLPILQAWVNCGHSFACNDLPLTSPVMAVLVTLFWERTIWFQVGLSVWLSNFPVTLKKKMLFKQARSVVDLGNENLIKIGITGSYGKSSTKELLVHMLKSEFGDAQVLYNPANNNTEVAIARLILNNQDFFTRTDKRFLVIETGAYKKGEIATVAKMIHADYGILTGLNQQHVELFGSIENIRKAKFELAQGTQKVVFFNGDNPKLVEIFEQESIKATKIPISFKAAKDCQSYPDKTTFKAYGQDFTLPWPGEFFVHNALLALECARESGADHTKFAKNLATIAPLERALKSELHPGGFTVLTDTYSANPDGVLQAIEHLKNFSGKRIFVSIPLRELGGHAETVHAQIFEKLKSINADVFWEKDDFANLGKEILGDKFHQDFKKLEDQIPHLGKNDVVLLESKLASSTLDLFKS